MKEEYDFSHAERGRFYRPDANLELPVHLDEEVYRYLQNRAKAKGIDVEELVNEVLRQNIKLYETLELSSYEN